MQHSLAFTSPEHAPRHLPPLDAELELYWLALTLVPGLGPRRGKQIIERFGDIRSAFSASRDELEQCGLSGTLAQSIASGCTFDEAAEQQNRARSLGVAIVPMEDPRYPEPLREIHEAPLVLFGRGNISLLREPSVAIVGTRRPSTYGKSVSDRLARDLSALGFAITSGMARGIDTYAHRGALEAGGATIAVFGSGVDVIYPAENKALAEQIAASGLLLSEYPLGTPSYPQNFPQRNRIVSGISEGIIVVEGAQYSGSAITARLAIDQGRVVAAVPGNITSRMSWGPNLLIKQGCVLIQDATDMLYALPSRVRMAIHQKRAGDPLPETPSAQQENPADALDAPTRRVLAALRIDEGKILDNLLDELPGMSSSEIIAGLFTLEMTGLAKQDAGQRYTKIWC